MFGRTKTAVGGFLSRLGHYALRLVYAGFTIFGTWTAITAHNATDRWAGLGCVGLFGGGWALTALIKQMQRGPRAAPSVALRIDRDGEPRLDRLELHPSRIQILTYCSMTAVFAAIGIIGLVLGGDLVGRIAGIVGLALTAGTVALTILIAMPNRAPVVLDLESLTYRRPFRSSITVPYRTIGALFVMNVGTQPFVAIDLDDFDATFEAADERERKRLASSMRWNGVPYVLPVTVNASAEQLMELIAQYVDAERARGGLPALETRQLDESDEEPETYEYDAAAGVKETP